MRGVSVMREARRPAPVSDSGFPPLRRASIGSLKSRPATCAPRRASARARSPVPQQRPARAGRAAGGPVDHAPFPMPVQAKALEIVEQVVARGDRENSARTLAARWSPGS